MARYVEEQIRAELLEIGEHPEFDSVPEWDRSALRPVLYALIREAVRTGALPPAAEVGSDAQVVLCWRRLDVEVHQPNVHLTAMLETDFDERRFPSPRAVWRCIAYLVAVGGGDVAREAATELIRKPMARLKQLIRPEKAQVAGEDGFRFRHLLIRDAAYDALPKAVRADLHERFAASLEAHGAELVELDELLGYHLEQAACCAAELGQPDSALRERAGEHLSRAGRRAISRGDGPAAAALLERALALRRPLRLDVVLELDLADAQQTPRERAALAEQTAERASAAGDQAGEALALVLATYARLSFEHDSPVDELERLVHAALPLLEEADDDAGLAWVWFALGNGVLNFRGQLEEWAQAAETALRHIRLAGHHPVAYGGLPHALVLGPRPADEALDSLDRVLAENPHPVTLLLRAQLLAMLERFDEAWALALPAVERQREVYGEDAWGASALAEIAALAGDHATAADHLRRWCDFQQRHGNRALLSTSAPRLGRLLCALRRYDEAEPLAELGRELGSEQDFATQMLWRQVRALVHAHRGEHAEAEALARDAVGIAERTDGLNHQGDAFCHLAEVLESAGRTDEAAETLEQALERYERKKNLAMIAQVRPRLDALRAVA